MSTPQVSYNQVNLSDIKFKYSKKLMIEYCQGVYLKKLRHKLIPHQTTYTKCICYILFMFNPT